MTAELLRIVESDDNDGFDISSARYICDLAAHMTCYDLSVARVLVHSAVLAILATRDENVVPPFRRSKSF